MTTVEEKPDRSVLLTVRAMEKTYFSTEPPSQVLRGIDLQVRTGEWVAVMGASGSGKSTLLYCASGMDRPTSGEVALKGQLISNLDDRAMSEVRLTKMGFVFQQAFLLQNLNVRDNILLPALKAKLKDRAEVEADVDTLIERFDIGQVAHHGITQVSGGQLQRASICRALATSPEILFADEPTGALNSTMTLEVMDALTDAHQGGATIMMVTHEPACAARADRVVYLRDGRIVGEREAGSWSAPDASSREAELAGWLRDLGF